jgi:hypothetical protein
MSASAVTRRMLSYVEKLIPDHTRVTNAHWLLEDVYWHWRRVAEPFYAWRRSIGGSAESLLVNGQFPLQKVFTATTHACNARCGFCAYPIMKPPKAVLSVNDFEQFVLQWKDLGGKRINLTPTFGDPLLDPTLCQKVLIARDAGLKVFMTTNGIE